MTGNYEFAHHLEAQGVFADPDVEADVQGVQNDTVGLEANREDVGHEHRVGRGPDVDLIAGKVEYVNVEFGPPKFNTGRVSRSVNAIEHEDGSEVIVDLRTDQVEPAEAEAV